VNGKFRQVVVSPEIAISTSFQKGVTSKEGFYTRLHALCIDEGHCMTLWGGTFHPDYGNLGILRGCFPKNVPIVVASATLPEHILDDIRWKLRLSQSVKVVSISNARPNIALSVRAMQHSDESKADLRFLIPKDASKPEDIPVTLVYCNQWTVAEDAADHLRDWAGDCGIAPDCIAFYHSKVGQKRKRELEEKLRKGEIRILLCTDAVGMVRQLVYCQKFSYLDLDEFRGVICETFHAPSFGVFHRHSVLLFKEQVELREILVN